MSGFLSSTPAMFLLAVSLFGFIVVIHEFGHFLACKMFGVGTPIFAIGVGPKWLTFDVKKWNTTWRLAPFLVIGYVAMKSGDDDEFQEFLESKFGRLIAICLVPVFWIYSALIPNPRKEDEDEEEETNEGLGLSEIRPWKRFLIAFAGPGINLISAGFVMFLLFFLYGKEAFFMATNNSKGIWTGLDAFLIDSQYSIPNALYNAGISLALLSYVFVYLSCFVLKALLTGGAQIHGAVETMEMTAVAFKEVDTAMGGISFAVICGIFVFISIFLAIINLAPIPGLDGCNLLIEPLRMILPKKTHSYVRVFVKISGITLVAVIMTWSIGRDVFVYLSRFFGYLFLS